MKKKLLIAVLALIAVSGCVLGLTACDDHEHMYIPYSVSKEPTCMEEGEQELYCLECGESKFESLPKVGHNYSNKVVTVAATCTESGKAEQTCTMCGDVKESIVPANGHDYRSVEIERATCQKAGLARYTCTGCGDTYDKPIPVQDHDYDSGVTTKQATCTEAGVKVFTCSMCTYSYTQTIPATGHTSNDGITVKQPTCTELGKKIYNCSTCGEELKQEAVPATGHTSDSGTIVKQPTCTEIGKKIFSCRTCGEEVGQEAVPAKGHRPVGIAEPVEATCQHTGKTAGSVCSVCDVVIEEQKDIPIADHSYEQGVCKWCELEKEFTVLFVIDGKTVKTCTFTVSNKTIEEPEIPDLEGYEEGRWESYTLEFSDITVNAIYTAINYTVTLEAEGGTLELTGGTIPYNSRYVLPVPEYEGHDFMGWFDGTGENAVRYTDEEGAGLTAYRVAGDKTLYAKWETKKVTVTFETDGDKEIPAKKYNYGDKFYFEEIPVKAGFTFDGWYSEDGETLYTANTVLTEDLTVYAKWINSSAISTAEQLIAVASEPDKNYHLTNDINLMGEVWSPIANFSGKLNGNGYTIKNFSLSSNAPDSNFGFVRINNGVIENISFADFTLNTTFSESDGNHVAVVAGTNNSKIVNCNLLSGVIKFNYSINSGRVNITKNLWFGGIAAYSAKGSEISGCSSKVDITASFSNSSYDPSAVSREIVVHANLGGLVGESFAEVKSGNYSGTIDITSITNGTEFYGDGNITTTYVYVGGIIGRNSADGKCSESFSSYNLAFHSATRNIYRNNLRGGGVVGINYGIIENCYAVGKISGAAPTSNCVGGFVGYNNGGEISSCYSMVEVNSDRGGNVGGFAGINYSVIQNCYSSGNVTSTAGANIGGFVGNNESSGTISKCYSTGDVNTVGGNIGHFAGACAGVVFKCYFMQGATLLSSGKYIDRVVEYETIEGQLYSKLWSEEFLVDDMYWEAEGWVIVVDENPLLQWEIEVSHDFKTLVVNPTCEYGGFTIYSCSDCNRLFVKDFKDPLGHSWQDVRTIPPTCTAEGYTLQRCVHENCTKERQVNTVAATGHPQAKVTEKDNSHAATCTAGGYIIYHCDECNSDYRVDREAKGHDGEYRSTEKAATCTEEGEDIYYCNVCHEEYSVITAKPEHNWTDVAYKAASCGTIIENGEIVGRNPVMGNMPGIKCADCGEIKYGCEEINPHKFELTQTAIQATCTADGSGTFKCSECLYEEQRAIPALGHTDADRDNICDVCGELAFTIINKNAFTHISDVNGLKAIANNPSGFYWLDKDIDLSGVSWTPLGTEQLPFKGIFYGNNHTISGLSFNISNSDTPAAMGLFGYNKGQIVNLKVSSFSLTVYNAGAVFGGIAAYNYGSVLNCALTGDNSISFTLSKVIKENKQTYLLEYDLIAGGIVGINDQTGSVESCTVSGTITSAHSNYCAIETPAMTIWQLIGQWMVEFIYETKVNTIQHVSLGGIAGRNEGRIKACAVTGQITSVSYARADLEAMRGEAIAYTHIYAGALVGYNTGLVSGCTAKAMAYQITNANDFVNIPDLITGKTYKRGFWIYNYAKNNNAVNGIVGTNSAFGSVEDLTVS